MITIINEENLSSFENLIPIDLVKKLDDPDYFGLGAVGTDENEEGVVRAVGAMVFSLQSLLDPFSESEDETFSVDQEEDAVGELNWIYVVEDQRRRGYGSSLLEAFFKIMEDAAVKALMCDVPFGMGYDGLVRMLEAWDFDFEVIDKYELETTIGELIQKKAVRQYMKRKAKCPEIHRLSDLPKSYYLEAIRTLKDRLGDHGSLSCEFEEDIEAYDADTSVFYIKDDVIYGIMLNKKLSSGALLPVVLRNLHGNDPSVKLDLLMGAIRCSALKYNKETQVKVEAISEGVANIIGLLFPEEEPTPYRRGVTVAFEVEDTDSTV